MTTVKSASILPKLPSSDAVLSKKNASKRKKTKSVEVPLTVGEKLRRARLKMGIDLLEAERRTLIRAKYLEALENAKYYQLPNSVYVSGFLQNYASFLKLNPTKLLSQFQKEYGVANQASLSNLSYKSNLRLSRFAITPKLIWVSVISLAVIAIVGYLATQVYFFSGVPMVSISSPSEQAVVSSRTFTVSGKTEPGVTVKVGSQVIPVDENGNFAQEVNAGEVGIHTIIITAESRTGKLRSITRSIKVEKTINN
ncbi:MAG: helix-turn-helix domain-containing protein [Patescibacteria group bacterium]|jgi:cytoskeletal protein RodZ